MAYSTQSNFGDTTCLDWTDSAGVYGTNPIFLKIKPFHAAVLSDVGHWVLHCIVQCMELRPYPEELDNN